MELNARRNRALCELAVELVAAAARRAIPLRILGGLAIYVKCASHRAYLDIKRSPFADIDLVTRREYSEGVAELLQERDCAENLSWKMVRSHERRLFYTRNNVSIELFLDDLRLAQRVPLRNRLELDYPTICPTDLLLSRVQKVHLEAKDLTDVCVLLMDFDFGPDATTALDLPYIRRLAASDWRWWRAWLNAFDQLAAGLGETLAEPQARQTVLVRLSRLRQELETCRKTLPWRLRSVAGDKLRWYDEVETG